MNNPLRIVFMGTPTFALGVLQTLTERHYHIVGVVSAPDKPAGRGLQLHSSEVAQYARAQNIPLVQPVLPKEAPFIEQLKEWNADLFVVVAFRMLPQEVWSLPRLGTFNLHASLLPQYRGAAPINWALIRGETITGVTTFMIDHQIDTGHILFQEPLPIAPDECADSLHDRLMVSGADLVCRTIDALLSGTALPKPQPLVAPLYGAPKLSKETCRIQWHGQPAQICNQIRGLSPYPAAFAFLHTSDNALAQEPVAVKIFKATSIVKEHKSPLGTIVSDHKSYLHVACTGGYVSINELQMAGKRRMSINDFLLGFRNTSQYRFI